MIKKWMAKAAVQKTISYLPYKTEVNFFFQKYITKGVLLTDDYFELKIIHAADHLQFFRQYSDGNFQDKTTLELGSGWYPIVPVAMFLSGFETIISLDITNWMNKKRVIQTLEKFVEWSTNERLDDFLPIIEDARWKQMQEIIQLQDQLSLEEICRLLRLKLMIKDARNTELPNQSIDYISSNNTYEHIYPLVLKFIIKEFKRILAPDGVMSHFIDLSDHFAHFDKNITIYNFLQYSEKQWQRIDNDIQPQNRLRWKDYIEMYDAWTISYTEEKVRPGSLEDLEKVKTSSMFSDYTKEELAISHGYFVSY